MAPAEVGDGDGGGNSGLKTGQCLFGSCCGSEIGVAVDDFLMVG